MVYLNICIFQHESETSAKRFLTFLYIKFYVNYIIPAFLEAYSDNGSEGCLQTTPCQ